MAVWAWMRPKVERVELLVLHEVAELGVRLEALGLVERELDQRVLDHRDGRLGAVDAHASGLDVQADVDVLVAGGDAPVGRLDGLLHGADELLAGDALLRVQLQKGADEFTTHVAPPLHHRARRRNGPKLSRSQRNVGVTHVPQAADSVVGEV